MTSIAFHPPAITVRLPETAISDQARWLRQQWRDLVAVDSSITQGADLHDLVDRVREAAAVASQPNWDGEGAAPVAQSAVEFARLFAAALPAGLRGADVSADRDGDISFDWGTSERQTFSVSVRRDGALSYAGLFGAQRYYGTAILAAGLPADLVHGISRAVGGNTALAA